MIGTLHSWPPTLVVAVGLALVGALGVADYFTGVELSFSVFYLGPVVLVTWYASRWFGYGICVVGALVSFFADEAAGRTYSHWLIAGESVAIHLLFLLVTALLLVALKARLKRDGLLARTDALTGVLNAQGFRELSDRLIRLAARHHHSMVVTSIDLGDFRTVTDVQGRSAADTVLVTVAHTLSSCVRASDVVGRLADDTFAVLMPETSRHGAQVAMAKIHERLVCSTEAQGWTLDMSIGVALFSKANARVGEALDAAQRLMRQAKLQGESAPLYEEQPVARNAAGNKHHAFRQSGTSEKRVVRALSRR